MHVVIMGCGRVGALLAGRLGNLGHSVAVIDQVATAFGRLPADFAGITVAGIGFDRETLESAGISRAGAFAAVSSGDNSNILAARVARETFGVERVVARIYDPRRAEVYQRLGIPTVATVAWTTGQILRGILPMGAHEEYRDPSGSMALAEVHVGTGWVGHRATSLEEASGARIAFITRFGAAVLPKPDTVVQDGDIVHALYLVADRDGVENVFQAGPEGTS
ncbi:MAG: TrkA family potassium uptake protein [Actinobacteria bacterium]|nr:TrkA family potassium uptake protein [Actinomycetota bacterium]